MTAAAVGLCAVAIACLLAALVELHELPRRRVWLPELSGCLAIAEAGQLAEVTDAR